MLLGTIYHSDLLSGKSGISVSFSHGNTRPEPGHSSGANRQKPAYLIDWCVFLFSFNLIV